MIRNRARFMAGLVVGKTFKVSETLKVWCSSPEWLV
jgi:hypothetical protein